MGVQFCFHSLFVPGLPLPGTGLASNLAVLVLLDARDRIRLKVRLGLLAGRMRFELFAATVAVLSLIACSRPEGSATEMSGEDILILIETPESTSETGGENTLIERPEYTGVIVSSAGASEFSYLFDQASTRFWDPSIDDISSAEKCIRQFLGSVQQDPGPNAHQKENAAFILENLEKYRCQYVGIEVDGEKRIWCNLLLFDNLPIEWQRVPVDVEDGGRNTGQIEYIVLKDECTTFHVQGEA